MMRFIRGLSASLRQAADLGAIGPFTFGCLSIEGFSSLFSSVISVSGGLAEIAARDGQGDAGDVGSLVGGQEQDRRACSSVVP